MDAEIAAIERNDTWELSELPKGHKTIGVKWIYKTKLKENGEQDLLELLLNRKSELWFRLIGIEIGKREIFVVCGSLG